MTSSFFFLSQLRRSLTDVLDGAVLSDAYWQSKQSVILAFEKKDGLPFYIEAYFGVNECLLNFPTSQSKSRKAITVFKELIGLTVLSLEQAKNERAFAIHLTGKNSIVFKWFGRQSNILQWQDGEVKGLLRSKLKNDEQFNHASFHKHRAWTEEEFISMGGELSTFIPQLGKETIRAWCTFSHWDEVINLKDKWLKVEALLAYLKQPTYYILQEKDRARFTLFHFKHDDATLLAEEHDPITAANVYFSYHYKLNRVEALREELALFYTNKHRSLQKQITQLSEKIIAFDEAIPPQHLADIIMANLHAFQGKKEAELLNFYTGEQTIVKIKDRLSAVEYASLLYKKSKNRQTEKNKMSARVDEFKTSDEQLSIAFANLAEADVKSLLHLREEYLPVKGISAQQQKALEPPVFKEYECQGYKIFVGRNAKNNDELTLHFAHKEDLWLHAKDVSGSHVIIKHKADKVFPKPVLERAAQLAAFYSKRKNDSLCPVMYTQKKYVRKVKGTAAGMVRVERESVILVEPIE